MDGREEDLFQKDSFDSSDNNFKDYSLKKVHESLENVCEDIPVTFDSSSNENSTDYNASDYDSPEL